MNTQNFTIADVDAFVSEKFENNTTAKSLFKKLPVNIKLFLMNNTNGNLVDKFTKEYADVHESQRQKSLDAMLNVLGYDETKNYEPKAQADERKASVSATKSMDRWAKIVLINVVRAIFGIKMDLERGFEGLEQDLKNYFLAKKSFDVALCNTIGITDESVIDNIRKLAIARAYNNFSMPHVPIFEYAPGEYAALVNLLGAHYKNYYFGITFENSAKEEADSTDEKINILIQTTADGLAKTGGFDKDEMVDEVKEALPTTLSNLAHLVTEML